MTEFLIPTPMPEELRRALTHILDAVWGDDEHLSISDLVDDSFHEALETVRRHLVGITQEACEEDVPSRPWVRGEGWSL